MLFWLAEFRLSKRQILSISSGRDSQRKLPWLLEMELMMSIWSLKPMLELEFLEKKASKQQGALILLSGNSSSSSLWCSCMAEKHTEEILYWSFTTSIKMCSTLQHSTSLGSILVSLVKFYMNRSSTSYTTWLSHRCQSCTTACSTSNTKSRNSSRALISTRLGLRGDATEWSSSSYGLDTPWSRPSSSTWRALIAWWTHRSNRSMEKKWVST